MRVNGGAWYDFHPGGNSGSRAVDWTTPPTALGTYQVEFQYYFLGAGWKSFITLLTVVPPAQRKFESSDRVTVTIDNSNGTFTTHRRSTIHLWTRGRTDYEQRDRPLLVVEGIDSDNKNSAATYLALGSAGEQGIAGDTLFPTSLRFGADVGVMDFADGGRDMAYNAQVVKGAVRFFRAWRSRPDVGFGVAGVSMGGVVARYALAEMEDEQSRGLEQPHGVAHFVSLDAPQQGAVIDGDLQNTIRGAVSASDAPSGLSRMAGKQLLRYAAFDTSIPTQHQTFFQRLRALNGGTGYPQQTDNIGVSFGTAARNAGESSPWVQFRAPGYFDVHFSILNDIAEGGSLLPEDQANQWGPVLILFTYELIRDNKPDPTFIQHASALDISAGSSAFDFPLSANFPRFHDRVPTEIVRPVLERMGYRTPPPPEPVAPLAVTINGPYHVPTNPGSWTASVNRSVPNSFSYSWRYRLDLNGNCGGPIDDDPLLRTGSTSTAKKPGGGETNLINQCVWTNGPTSPTFSYSIAADAWLDIEVTATNGTQSVTQLRRVGYGSLSGGGDGPLAASPSVDGLSPATSSETEAVAVETFEVAGVRPSVVRSGGRVAVSYALPEASDVEIVVRDVLGRMHHHAVEMRPAGRHRSELSVPGLPAALYLVTVRAGQEQRMVRFVVQ